MIVEHGPEEVGLGDILELIVVRLLLQCVPTLVEDNHTDASVEKRSQNREVPCVRAMLARRKLQAAHILGSSGNTVAGAPVQERL
jgi:hypothetical protein